MNKRTYCLENETIGYYSGWGGIEIHGMEYECGEDYVYFVGGAWGSTPSYHKAKVQYTLTGNPYFNYRSHRIPLSECLRS